VLDRPKAFKRREGHCNVPSRFRGVKQLASWMHEERKWLHKMPEWRFLELQALGFVWALKTGRKPSYSVDEPKYN